MEYVEAKNTEEDFKAFLKLEEAFNRYYEKKGIGDQYKRVPFEKQAMAEHVSEYAKFLGANWYFIFVKDKDQYVGYFAGTIEPMPAGYVTREVGYADSMIILEKYRDQGVGRKCMDMFTAWLKERGIQFCQLHVKSKNTEAVEKYRKWGFETDELRMWKKI